MNFKPKPGEKNPNARLTWKDVRTIRELYEHGMARMDLAKRFGVSVRSIAMIVAGVTWQEDGYVYRPHKKDSMEDSDEKSGFMSELESLGYKIKSSCLQ